MPTFNQGGVPKSTNYLMPHTLRTAFVIERFIIILRSAH
jgi:hypothetical protein